MNNTETIEAIKNLPDEQGGFCRDCADDGPFCPNRGMPCAISVTNLKALVTTLERHNAALEHYANPENFIFGGIGEYGFRATCDHSEIASTAQAALKLHVGIRHKCI